MKRSLEKISLRWHAAFPAVWCLGRLVMLWEEVLSAPTTTTTKGPQIFNIYMHLVNLSWHLQGARGRLGMLEQLEKQYCETTFIGWNWIRLLKGSIYTINHQNRVVINILKLSWGIAILLHFHGFTPKYVFNLLSLSKAWRPVYLLMKKTDPSCSSVALNAQALKDKIEKTPWALLAIRNGKFPI